MRGKDIIVTFNEPWYNDYTRRLYTQLSEQMIREEIEKNQSLLILHLIWQ